MHLANVALRAQERGATAVVVTDPANRFVYIPDGPDGPIDVGGPTERVESFEGALELAKRTSAQPGIAEPPPA